MSTGDDEPYAIGDLEKPSRTTTPRGSTRRSSKGGFSDPKAGSGPG
eukprot:CAMPEP_0172633846 /NCGR_PEP_ID=MMETSP1068-20121228/191594_1 /TAXON_ID=35684 /ORGANISM="Pseudopedinella elastica, Strain CCMP716" /LENGTH=45 /DNA_ID= /DNA_START= /DNA_END= /DNA_ORIENTATION=